MPAGPPLAPGGLPIGLAVFLRLPQNKIQRILFFLATAHLQGAVSRLQIIQIFMGQFSVICKAPGTVVYCAVLIISVSLIDEHGDHFQHPADLLCCQRMGGGRQHIHIRHILLTFCNITFCHRIRFNALLNGFGNDLIIHICKIGNVIHFKALVFQIASDCIEHDHGAGVADVDKIIDRGAAHIHADLSGYQRYKFFLSLAQCIIDLHVFLHHHSFSIAFLSSSTWRLSISFSI